LSDFVTRIIILHVLMLWNSQIDLCPPPVPQDHPTHQLALASHAAAGWWAARSWISACCYSGPCCRLIATRHFDATFATVDWWPEPRPLCIQVGVVTIFEPKAIGALLAVAQSKSSKSQTVPKGFWYIYNIWWLLKAF